MGEKMTFNDRLKMHGYRPGQVIEKTVWLFRNVLDYFSVLI